MNKYERRAHTRRMAQEAAGNAPSGLPDVILGVLLYVTLVGLTLAGMAWRGL